MLKRGNILVYSITFLVLSSCSVDYKFENQEHIILNKTKTLLKERISFELKQAENINKKSWNNISDDGNKPRDVKIGEEADFILDETKEFFNNTDSIIQLLDLGANEKVTSIWKSKYNKVLFLINKDKKLLEYQNFIPVSLQIFSILSRSYGIVESLVRKQDEYLNIIPGCCICFEPINLEVFTDYEVIEEGTNSHFVTFLYLDLHIQNPIKKDWKINKGNIEEMHSHYPKIPITNQPKGHNQYQLLVKSKYHNKEVVDTLTGYYVVR